MTTNGRIWTIGHWTCPEDVVLATLASAEITMIADVRKMPGSRKSPQFDSDVMLSWLEEAGIEYEHHVALGGRRPRQRNVDVDVNSGWQNSSFKNYADYTLTPEFEEGLEHLMDQAATARVAIMCGEPMPWRCHRLLLSNTLTARGWHVQHLINGSAPRRHELGQWGATPVMTSDGVLTYPLDAEELRRNVSGPR